jgi:transposase
MGHKQIPAEALINLRQRLDLLPSRCQERSILVKETATLYGVSRATLYRLLRQHSRPKAINRSDSGQPRKLSPTEMELYCEIIAAMKIRTSNKKGRHLSTARAIELLTEYGAVFVIKNTIVSMEKMLKQHCAFYLMQ